MAKPRILAFAGSARKGSFNKQLVAIAARAADKAGAEVTILDLREFALPLFDEDLESEHGTPENATKLKRIFIDHDGLLISCPEYNSSITPLLKNTIDWGSRKAEGESPLAAYRGKVASLMSASPGGLGGLRGLVHVRAILSNIGVTVLPDQVAVGKAFEAFKEEGGLQDAKLHSRVEALGTKLTDVLSKLNS